MSAMFSSEQRLCDAKPRSASNLTVQLTLQEVVWRGWGMGSAGRCAWWCVGVVGTKNQQQVTQNEE